MAAIAIPNMFDGKKAANEASALAILESIFAAQAALADRDLDGDGQRAYATSLVTLLHFHLVTGLHKRSAWGMEDAKDGYDFWIQPELVTVGEGRKSMSITAGYRAYAAPVRPGRSGDRSFLIDESGTIRFTTTSLAPHFATESSDGPALGG